MKPEKLYRCPACGDVTIEKDWLVEMESGGSGYCMCGFSETDDEGNVWYPRIYHEYDVYLLKPRGSKPTAKHEHGAPSDPDVCPICGSGHSCDCSPHG